MGLKVFFSHTCFREIIVVDKEVTADSIHNDKSIFAIGVIELESSSVSFIVD